MNQGDTTGPRAGALSFEERALPRPGLLALVSLILGLITARSFGVESAGPGLLLIVVAVLAGAASRQWPEIRTLTLLLGFAGAGLLILAPANRDMSDARSILAAFDREGAELVQISGRLTGDPSITGDRAFVRLAPDIRVAQRGREGILPAGLTVWLPLKEKAAVPDFAPGDTLVAVGTFRPHAERPQPGEYEYFAVSRGFPASFKAGAWEVSTPARRSAWSRLRLATRSMADATERTLRENLSNDAGGILAAMTLGRTGSLSPEDRESFTRAGLMHLFAVSGLHTGLVGVMLAFLCSALGLGPRWRAAITIAGIAAFCLLTGLRVSALRAGVLVGLYVLRPAVGREVDPLGALSSVALLFLLLRPRWLWQPDFQMSFLCAFTLVLVTPGSLRIQERLGARWNWSIWGMVLIRVLQVLFVTLCIQVALAPVLAAHFRSVSLAAPLANAVVLPFVPLVMAATFVATGVALAWPLVGELLFGALEPVVEAGAGIARLIGDLPGAAVPFRGIWPAWAIGAYYLVLLSGRWVRLRAHFTAWDGAGSALGSAAAAGMLVLWIPFFEPEPPLLTMRFLDVGQGDAVLVQVRGGATMLVDAGPDRNGVLAGELQRLGVRQIDALIVTHADADHIGEAARLIETMPPGGILMGGSHADSEAWRELNAVVDFRDVPVSTISRGAVIDLGSGVRVEVLHPTEEFVRGGLERNDASVVLRVVAGEVAILLTGDAAEAAEADMLGKLGGSALASDVLKAGHHGSEHSTTSAFLRAAAPSVAVVSCGRNNRYGHPDPELLERFEEAGVQVWRTDWMGAVTIESDGRSIWIETERAANLSLAAE